MTQWNQSLPKVAFELLYLNSVMPELGGHCALNGILRGHFPGNQDGAVNLKSELIFIKF